MMYESLVKRLRCLRFGNCPECPMWYSEEVEPNLWRERCAAIEAADAIEELSAIREEQKAQIILMAAEDKPRWISVEERLPDIGETVWAVYKNSLFPNGKSHHKTLKYDGAMWTDENGYRYLTANITHWKHRDPLPSPPDHIREATKMVEPKEET